MAGKSGTGEGLSSPDSMTVFSHSIAQLLQEFQKCTKTLNDAVYATPIFNDPEFSGNAEVWLSLIEKELDRGNVLSEYILDVLAQQKRISHGNENTRTALQRRLFIEKLTSRFNPVNRNFAEVSMYIREAEAKVQMEIEARNEDDRMFGTTTTTLSTKHSQHSLVSSISSPRDVPEYIAFEEASKEEYNEHQQLLFELDRNRKATGSGIPNLEYSSEGGIHTTKQTFGNTIMEREADIAQLEKEIGELNEMFSEMEQLTAGQQDGLDVNEKNSSQASERIGNALTDLFSASKLKQLALPIAAATAGAIVAGPVGFVMGIKGGAALGACAAAGAGVGGVMGRLFKSSHNNAIENVELETRHGNDD